MPVRRGQKQQAFAMKLLGIRAFCSGLSDDQGDQVLLWLVRGSDPRELCGKILLCSLMHSGRLIEGGWDSCSHEPDLPEIVEHKINSF